MITHCMAIAASGQSSSTVTAHHFATQPSHGPDGEGLKLLFCNLFRSKLLSLHLLQRSLKGGNELGCDQNECLYLCNLFLYVIHDCDEIY